MSARRLEAGLALIAFLIAGYLTYERHLGQNALCPVGGGGCETVAHSSYSKFAGVPVSYFGMLGALVLLALCVRPELLYASLRFVVAGVGAAVLALPHLARGDDDQRVLRLVPRQRDGLVPARGRRGLRSLAPRRQLRGRRGRVALRQIGWRPDRRRRPERVQHGRHGDAAVGALVRLEDRDQRARRGHGRAVQRVQHARAACSVRMRHSRRRAW